MSEKKEGKEVKLSFTADNLFVYGAIVDAVLGVVWAICGCFDSMDAFKAYNVFQGLFFAVLGGLVIYGLGKIVKSKQ
jgi:hypothetical protein